MAGEAEAAVVIVAAVDREKRAEEDAARSKAVEEAAAHAAAEAQAHVEAVAQAKAEAKAEAEAEEARLAAEALAEEKEEEELQAKTAEMQRILQEEAAGKRSLRQGLCHGLPLLLQQLGPRPVLRSIQQVLYHAGTKKIQQKRYKHRWAQAEKAQPCPQQFDELGCYHRAEDTCNPERAAGARIRFPP